MAHFKELRGRTDGCAEGPRKVIEALQMAVVDTLLVADDDEERRAWFGPDPTHVALDRSDVEAMGVSEPEEAPLVDVAIRAAIGTGAHVRVVPRHAIAERIGAILRSGSVAVASAQPSTGAPQPIA
jgi:peptide subunit release factor 1 (eRF1)